jgi:hypothetical protein
VIDKTVAEIRKQAATVRWFLKERHDPSGLILACCCGRMAQAAQWNKVGGSSGNVFYIDKASIIKTDKTRKVWSMQSYGARRRRPRASCIAR